MRSRVLLCLSLGAIALAGCAGVQSRIRAQPELFQSLDRPTQEKVRRGQIEVGFTPEMVELALGEPSDRSATPRGGAVGETVWTYRNLHRDRNDIIAAGYRRRIVFDPVSRSETVVIEPIDDRLAARLAPKSLRLTFRDGRLAVIEHVPEM